MHPMKYTSILLPCLLCMFLLSSPASAHGEPNAISQLELSMRIETAVSAAWELLNFAPTPKALEDMIIAPEGSSETEDPANLWVFAVFVNTSKAHIHRSTDLVHYMLIPATESLRDAVRAKSAAHIERPLSARVVVADLDAARTYFRHYPFGAMFGESVGDVSPPLEREAMLTAVEQMVHKGFSVPRRRTDPSEPVALFLRPGAAAHFRAGRGKRTEKSKKSEKSEKSEALRRAIGQAQPGTLFLREDLAELLVEDYGDSLKRLGAAAEEGAGAQEESAVSEEKERQHRETMLRAIEKIRARMKERYNNPYDMDALKDMSAEDRVATLIKRIKERNAADLKDGGEDEEDMDEEESKTKEGEGENKRDSNDSAYDSSTASASTKETLVFPHDDL